MVIISWVIVGAWLFYLANRHDKKMNENFINIEIKSHALEERIQHLEYDNQDKDKTIEYLRDDIKDLRERIYELEKPYQRSTLDDLD